MALPKDLHENERKPQVNMPKPAEGAKPQLLQFNPQKMQKVEKRPAPTYGTMISSIKVKFKNLGAKARSFFAHEKTLLFLVVVMLALVMGAVGSGLTGAVLGLGGQEENLTAQVIACQTNNSILVVEKATVEDSLGSCKDLNSQLSSQVSDYANTIKTRDDSMTVCQDELGSAKSSLSGTQSDLARAQATLEETRTDLDAAQGNIDALAQNYANRYCCQLRILGFNYNAYAVLDNNVVCLTSGEKLINCTA